MNYEMPVRDGQASQNLEEINQRFQLPVIGMEKNRKTCRVSVD